MEKLVPVGLRLNAYTFAFDPHLLDEIAAVYRGVVAKLWESDANALLLEGGAPRELSVPHEDYRFFVTSYGTTPLLWISADDSKTHRLFLEFFNALGIAKDVKTLVDHDKDIVMYCGFFVVGNRLPGEAWHVDYYDGANAYTLLTPLFSLDGGHGHLLYKDNNGATRRYAYRPGHAIIVGDRFHHTTEPYAKTADMRVLVSLTFGTDKLAYWDVLKHTVGVQSQFMILPCGHQKGACDCLPAGRQG